MKILRKVIIVIIILLTFFQIVAYIGNAEGKYNPEFTKHSFPNNKIPIAYYIAYYFGLNFYFIPIFILFIIARRMKKKINKKFSENNNAINAIGTD